MKKTVLVLLALALLSGCAGKVQQIGEIDLQPNSSQGLIDLQRAGATGVRDLTQKEFHKYRRDRRDFDEANEQLRQASINRAGNRALREGLMGAALGFSFFGSAATGYFSSLGSEKSYPFTKEYLAGNYIFSMDREIDRFELFDRAEDLFNRMNADLQNPAIGLVPNGDPTTWYGDSDYKVVERSTAVSAAFRQSFEGKKWLQISIYCRYEYKCAVGVWTGLGNYALPSMPVLLDFMEGLPGHYVLFVRPYLGEKRLPLVIYGGSTEYHYLVEQEVGK